MKIFFVCCMLFVVSFFSFAQQSKEEKIQQFKNREDIKVTVVEKDLLRLEYPNGKVIYENIGVYKYPESKNQQPVYSPTYDSTIIDLTTIDTTLYYQKYRFLQEVRVGSYQTAPPLVGDINNNDLSEIYGLIKDYNTDFSNNTVMEMNNVGGFDSVYSYDSTSLARSIYDIDKDGMDELFIHRFPPDTNYIGHSWLLFKKPSDTSFATDLFFVFYPFSDPSQNQINNNTFGDWDGDEYTDQIFGRECCPNSIFIYEYNSLINNFDSVYYYDPSQYDFFFSGFAIGDINQNGKTELFAGSVSGKVISIENCGDNCYAPNWQGMVETNNAYLYASTNDLDGNGKPEVWIGGYHFQNGEAITRITIFEASGNNNYIAVGKIDIIGAFNFYAKNMQVLDVDKDGKEEVMLCIEQHVIILKFNGSQNHHTYEVFYIKRNDLAFGGRNSVYYGATMYDVTNDGKEDIIIHIDDIIENVGMRLFTHIYKADFSVDVNEPIPLPEKFNLYQNYPNPFNPSTNIRFEIPERANVLIKVYNILGKEIKTLLEKELSPGNYTIDWEAKDSKGQLLPSGVYFIRLNAYDAKSIYTKTMKAVLLK
ncbi:MAG: T9SS type A sorting domain-containing protein [Ignavibacterium sp.]|nr:T9SS type A sorting domain-containing protein [Ignavibacterium sp.]